MKTISNKIRIGIVRRNDQSTPKSQENSNNQTMKEQKLSTQTDQRAPFKDHIFDQKPPADFVSPNNLRLHDITETNPKQNYYSNDLNSRISLQPPQPEKNQLSSIHEIPNKTKLLTGKKILIGISVAALGAAVIVIPTVLAIIFTRPADTTTTSSTTTVAPTVITVYWSFDNTLIDLTGNYTGSAVGGASFSSLPSNNTPYVGYGQALLLNGGSSQFVSVSNPHLNLTSRSFTIEAWIYSQSLIGDRGIFGQCQCSTCANQCLYFICRSARLHIGFISNDLLGSTDMLINTWYHVAFVYNYQTKQQILYINGVQDAIKSNAAPFQGQNASIAIGSTQVYAATNYFTGYIDNLQVTTRAKSSNEILRDASLMAYYSFDLPDPNYDSGPNKLNGTVNNTVTTSGRVKEGIRIVGASSYFYAYGFSQLPAGIYANGAFSISMWINPTSGSSSALVQLFGTWSLCYNLLGIYAPGGTGGQIIVLGTTSGPPPLAGPYVPQYSWTHISLTYSSTNGYTLYYNGISFGSTGSVSYLARGAFVTISIGFMTGCSNAFTNIPYQGSVDEVYIHNRELTQADVTTLANP